MEVIKSIKNKLKDIFKSNDITVLIIENETLKLINQFFTIKELSKLNIYSIVPIHTIISDSSIIKDLNQVDSIIFVSKTKSNLELISKELQAPVFRSYKIQFNTEIYEDIIEDIIKNDPYERITNIQFLDLNLKIINEKMYLTNENYSFESLMSILKILNCKRCSHCSSKNKNIEFETFKSEINMSLAKNKLKAKQDNMDTILISLNRNDDPFSPLITPWNQEAMVHEHTNCKDNQLSIKSNSYSISNSKFQDELKQMDLHGMNSKFESCKETIMNNDDMKFENIHDMNKIIESTTRKAKLKKELKVHLDISKHINDEISTRSLFCLSETEQEILNASRGWSLNSKLEKLFSDCQMDENQNKVVRLEMSDKLKLLVLFVMKFENESNQINEYCRILNDKLQSLSLDSATRLQLNPFNAVKKATAQAGKALRSLDSLQSKDMFKSITNQMQTDNNNFEKFQPLIFKICKLLDGKVDFLEGWIDPNDSTKKLNVIFVMKGGVTMTEYHWINKFNNNQTKQIVHIVSDELINSKEFISRIYNQILN